MGTNDTRRRRDITSLERSELVKNSRQLHIVSVFTLLFWKLDRLPTTVRFT